MTATEFTSDRTDTSIAANRAESFGKTLLLINGGLLFAVSLVASLADLAGHFLDIGPFAASHFGKPDAVAYFEAHGLALIASILLLLNRNAPSASWNWSAAAIHALLGAANLMFWPSFEAYGLVTMGIVTTAMHGFFFVLGLVAAFWRTPEILSGPGAWFRGLTLLTLATGAVLHSSSLPLGRERFVETIFTPGFDVVFAVPMTAAGVLGWLLLRRAIFQALWHRVVYIVMLLYFTLSIVIHARTAFTWDTSNVLGFPSWYSLPILVVMTALAVFTMRQRFTPAGAKT